MSKNEKCCICGNPIKGWGNNPDPFPGDKCCDKCNNELIVPVRIFLQGLYKGYLALQPKIDSVGIEMKTTRKVPLYQLQTLVDGPITFMTESNSPNGNEYFKYLSSKFSFVVNEEGLLHNLPYNQLAKDMFNLDVVGTLVIVSKEAIV